MKQIHYRKLPGVFVLNASLSVPFTAVSPLVKKRAFRWYGFFFLKYGQPVLFQLLEERVEVDIVHEHDSNDENGEPLVVYHNDLTIASVKTYCFNGFKCVSGAFMIFQERTTPSKP